MAWNNALPGNAEKIRLLGEVIRPNWIAIEENDTAVAATSLNQWVVHLIDRATIGGANTPARIDDVGMLYCRNDGTNNELYFQDSKDPANEVQLTRSDKVTDAANGQTFLPGGILLQWFTVSAPAGNTVVTFPTAFPTSVYNVTLTPQLTTSNVTDVDIYIRSAVTTVDFTVRNSTGVTYTLFVQAIGK